MAGTPLYIAVHKKINALFCIAIWHRRTASRFNGSAIDLA
jgi:hypothetical protein